MPRRSKDKGFNIKPSVQNCKINYLIKDKDQQVPLEMDVKYNKYSKQCCEADYSGQKFNYLKNKSDNYGYCYDNDDEEMKHQRVEYNNTQKKFETLYKFNQNKPGEDAKQGKRTRLLFSIDRDPTKKEYIDWIKDKYFEVADDENITQKLYLLNELKMKEGAKREYLDRTGSKKKEDIKFMDIFQNKDAKLKLDMSQQEIEDFRYLLEDLDDKIDEQKRKIELFNQDPSALDEPETSILLYDGIYGQLIIPLTKNTSCSLGSGTKWCTAARENNMFKDYSDKGPLFIWYDQRLGAKFQFHFEDNMFMDAKDEEIKSEILWYLLEVPVLNELFEQRLMNANKVVEFFYEHMKFEKSELFNFVGEDVVDYIMHTPMELVNLAIIYKVKLTLKQQDIVLQDAEAAYLYAYKIIKRRWNEAEEIIAKNGKAASNYALAVLRELWTDVSNMDEDLAEEAEANIAKNPEKAYEYIDEFMNTRWREAEPAILTNLDLALEYAKKFVKRRWPVLEDRLQNEPEYAATYAVKIIKKPWPQMEQVIASNPKAAVTYAQAFYENGWPEAEPEIAKHAKSAYDYAKFVLENRFPLGEKVILANAKVAAKYANKILKQPWPEAEKIIKTDTEAAYKYALKVIKGRWPDGENTIAKNPEFALKYAINVIKGPWPQGENSIKKDPDAAYNYAKQVINGKWPAGENAIKKNAVCAFNYANYIIKGRWPPGELAIASDANFSFMYADQILHGLFPLGEPAIMKEPLDAIDYSVKIMQKRWPELEQYIIENQYQKSYKDYLKHWKIKL